MFFTAWKIHYLIRSVSKEALNLSLDFSFTGGASSSTPSVYILYQAMNTIILLQEPKPSIKQILQLMNYPLGESTIKGQSTENRLASVGYIV